MGAELSDARMLGSSIKVGQVTDSYIELATVYVYLRRLRSRGIMMSAPDDDITADPGIRREITCLIWPLLHPAAMDGHFISTGVLTPTQRCLNTIIALGRRLAGRTCAGLVLAFAAAHVQSSSDSAASALQPANAPAAKLRRAADFVRDQHPDKAVALLRRLITQFPVDPAPYNELAVIYASRDDLERARAVLISAIEADSRYALIYKNLQTVFGALAGRAYDRALIRSAGERRLPALMSFVEDGSLPASVASMAPGDASPTHSTAEGSSAASSAPPMLAATVSATAGLPSTPAVVGSIMSTQSSSSPEQIRLRKNPAPPAPAEPRIELAASTIAAQIDEIGASPPDPDEIVSTVKAWAKAWSRQDVDGYLGYYGHHFTAAGGMSRARWSAQRRQRLDRPSFIKVAIEEVKVTFATSDRAVARFRQNYRSNILASKVSKVLQLSRNNGEWKIIRESVER